MRTLHPRTGGSAALTPTPTVITPPGPTWAGPMSLYGYYDHGVVITIQASPYSYSRSGLGFGSGPGSALGSGLGLGRALRR